MTGTKGTEPIGLDSVQTTPGETADPEGQWTRPTVLAGVGGEGEVIGVELLRVGIEGPLQPMQEMFRAVFYMKKQVAFFSCSSLPLCSQCRNVNPSTQQQRVQT